MTPVDAMYICFFGTFNLVEISFTIFSKEDFLRKAGLEVKLQRSYYKLVPVKASENVAGSRGQALQQRRQKFKRTKLEQGDEVASARIVAQQEFDLQLAERASKKCDARQLEHALHARSCTTGGGSHRVVPKCQL